MSCNARACKVYSLRMAEEPEDLNEFTSEDCGGAVFMLGLVPVVLNYVFNKEQMGLTIALGVAAVAAALAVYLLARLTGWSMVGRVVNLVGCVLVPVYVVAAVCLWCSPCAPTYGKIQALHDQKVQQAQKSPAGQAKP